MIFPRFFRLVCRALVVSAACLHVVGSASAIQPERWTHSTESDFADGEFDGVVVTNLGDLKLAAAVEPVAELPEEVSVVYDVEIIGETIYVAAGPEGKLLAVEAGEVREVAAPAGKQVFCLDQLDGVLLVGVSGSPSSVQMLYEEVLVEIAAWPETRYVWDLAVVGPDLVVATGSEGVVTRVSDARGYIQAVLTGEPAEPPAQGKLLDTAQANVLCLAVGPDRVVYAGTDTDGLIYRIDPDGSTYVVYDADEPEIGALRVTDDGTVYAGTADAEQARPGRLEEAAEEETGRPDVPAVPSEVAPEAESPIELPVEPEPLPLADPAADSPDADTPPNDLGGEEAAPQDAPAPDAVEDAEADAATESEARDAADDDASDTEEDSAGSPTAEQYDALREAVRERLLAARQSGSLDTRGDSPAASRADRPRPTRNARSSSSRDKSGNAVYRIDPEGFVTEVFRDSVMVLKLAQRPDGKLLIGTGNEGQLYLLDPAAGETSVLNDLEPQQLLAVAVAPDGLLVAGANPAALLRLSGGTAESGTYLSAPLDATQISLWGTFLLTAELQPGTEVEVETRSGNVADPEIAAWSPWENAGTVAYAADHPPLQPHEIAVSSPPARFLQYRLTFERPGDAPPGPGPVVEKIELAYVMPNLRPSLGSITAEYPGFPGLDLPASPEMEISWEASDDNGDRLRFTLDYQPAAGDQWLTLAEDLDDTSYSWDTRLVPDGRYRLRVAVTDRLDNPGEMALTAARRADPVLIDNTPPESVAMQLEVGDDGQVRLAGTAVDNYSPIHSIAYRLGDDEDYTPILPDDLIYDSTREAWSATLSDLPSGSHAVTVRATDTRGNANYVSELFEIP
ncbi:MAG: hypothetical protein AAGG38_08770 [Planctomycetota bacterium]